MGRYDFLLHATPDQRPAASPVESATPVTPTAPSTRPTATATKPSMPENTPAVAPPRARESRVGKRPRAAAPAHPTSHQAAADDAGPSMPNAAPPLRNSPSTHPTSQFLDASARADQKYTLAFTEEELEAMEDVKLELRRRYDLKTTKVALVRWGLRELIEDYRTQGEHSRLVTRMKAQRTAHNELEEPPPSTEEDAEHAL